MIELDVIDPTIECTGCGACCMHMRSPPHMVYLVDAEYVRKVIDGAEFMPWGEEDIEDCKRLLAAPAEARRAFTSGIFSDRPDNSPCSWLDMETKRCKWHEFRPDICRDYPVGGESCLATRVKGANPAPRIPGPTR